MTSRTPLGTATKRIPTTAKLTASRRRLRTTNLSAAGPCIGGDSNWLGSQGGGTCASGLRMGCCYLAAMRRAAQLGLAIASIAAVCGAVPVASGETTHTYPVALTISVDRAVHKISGTIVTDAPSEFCEISTVRVRRVMPGHDKVVAGIPPSRGGWRVEAA